MTVETILDTVRHEILFGCIECEIYVPEHLREQFSEMCPIFKNTESSRGNIGEFMHMESYAEENDIMTRPSSLIGGMKGEKILLATPLLEWYLEHGLEVTRVYQVIEYTPKPCFWTKFRKRLEVLDEEERWIRYAEHALELLNHVVMW